MSETDRGPNIVEGEKGTERLILWQLLSFELFCRGCESRVKCEELTPPHFNVHLSAFVQNKISAWERRTSGLISSSSSSRVEYDGVLFFMYILLYGTFVANLHINVQCECGANVTFCAEMRNKTAEESKLMTGRFLDQIDKTRLC